MSSGIIKDVIIATTLEMGDGVRGALVGIGLPLDINGFVFANANFIYAKASVILPPNKPKTAIN